jgi:hypothetical protein
VLCQISFTGPSGIPVEIRQLGTSHDSPLCQGRIDAPNADSPWHAIDSLPLSALHRKNKCKLLINKALILIGVPFFDVRERLGPHPERLEHPVFMLCNQHPRGLFSGPWRSQALRPVCDPVGR